MEFLLFQYIYLQIYFPIHSFLLRRKVEQVKVISAVLLSYSLCENASFGCANVKKEPLPLLPPLSALDVANLLLLRSQESPILSSAFVKK